MYGWLIYFILGAAGSHRWWGDVVDAPNPKDPRPWERIILMVVGGLAAIGASRLGFADADPMPGLVLAFATGLVAAGVARSAMDMSRK